MLSLENESPQTTSFNSKKIASVVTVAAGLAIAGIVVSQTKSNKTGSKLALINIPEEFSGTFTNTHDDGRYIVEGVFHKFEHEDGDWQVDGKFTAKGPSQSDTTYMTYTLKDDIFIEEEFNLTNDERIHVHCMEPQGFPTYGQGKEIFKKAVAINDFELVEKSRVKAAKHCEAGAELAVVNENGKPWVICGDYSNDNFEMTLMSQYITLHAKAVEGMVVDIEYPEDYDMEAHNCTMANDPVNHFNDLMLKGYTYEHRALEVKQTAWPFKQDVQEEETGRSLQYYVCPAGTRQRCFVFHGVANAGMNWWDNNYGNRNIEIRDVVYDIGGGEPNGWGGYPEGYDLIPELNDSTSNPKGTVYGWKNYNFQVMHSCTYSYFMDTETQVRGFHNDSTHIEYNLALQSSGLMNPDIMTNEGRCSHLLHAITHSMGGMLMAAGLITGNINRMGFQWGQAQNPWYGSVAANTAYTMCNWARWLSNPIVGFIVILLAILAVSAIVALCAVTGGAFAIVMASIGIAALGVASLILLALMINLVWGIFGNAAAIDREICVRGHRIGKHYAKAYPLPANVSIEFHRPIKFDNNGTWKNATDHDTEGQDPMMSSSAPFSVYFLNQNRNKASRAPNWRMCGNHPWGFATQYEANSPFKIASKKLERIDFNIYKKFDIVTGNDPYRKQWKNPRSYAQRTGCVYKNNGDLITCAPRWGNQSKYHQANGHDWFYNGNELTDGSARWSDGCVDVSNCMNYALYVYNDDAWRRDEFLEDNHFLNASNHDSGTCRAGQATSYVQDPCQRWERFFNGNAAYSATYYQMFSFRNGVWNGPDYVAPTPPPTFNPTPHPKNTDFLQVGGTAVNPNDPGPLPVTYGGGKGSSGPPPAPVLLGKGAGFMVSPPTGGIALTEEEDEVFEDQGPQGFLHMKGGAEGGGKGGSGKGAKGGMKALSKKK